MDIISVIVPVYKTEQYLDRCVQSIVDQTYKNLEIILVDDGSPDRCPEMCDQWAKKDDRIKALHIENKGVANARNIALEFTVGDYISFVDSDDYIDSNMLESLYNLIKKDSSDIAVCDFYRRGLVCNVPLNPDPETALQRIAVGDYLFGVLWNKLYKKEIIENVRMPLLVCCEDLVFNYFAIKKSTKISVLNFKKYHYCINNESVTSNDFNIGAFDAVISKEIILNDCLGSELEKYALKGLLNSCYVVYTKAIQLSGYEKECVSLRKLLTQYKSSILKSRFYSKKDKIKTIMICMPETLYKICSKII